MLFARTTERQLPRRLFLLLGGVVLCAVSWGQKLPSATPAASTPPAVPEDALGRDTPRGTVIGFLGAGRKKDYELASRYLNTRQRGPAASSLAEHLYVVLDHGLPPTLTQLSDKPEGSQKYPTDPNQDFVGAINSAKGDVDILLERIERPKGGPVWLFSKKTLDSVPDLYQEVDSVPVEERVPKFLTETRVGGVALIEWLALLVGLPLTYVSTLLLSRTLSAAVGGLLRPLRRNPALPNPDVLPGPLRLLVLAGIIRLALSYVRLPLLARQLWASISTVIVIAGCVWLAVRTTAWIERTIVVRFGTKLHGGAPLVRFVRRALDLLLIFIGVIITLHYFGVNTTAALAGLGVGGIAVALAAQKTLENVIGGLSLIFDQTFRLGDSLKVSDTIGTVDAIGLRSTRIRTLDRTMLSVPNGQIANASLENYSARDKFRFLHTLGLQYETTHDQMRTVLGEIGTLLRQHTVVERGSARVRFIRFGPSSLDIEIFAHLLARDWNHFLEVQEELLIRIMEIVDKAGAKIAFPSQTLYFAGSENNNNRAADALTRSHPAAGSASS